MREKYEDDAQSFSFFLPSILTSILEEGLSDGDAKIWAPWFPSVSVNRWYQPLWYSCIMRVLMHLGALGEIKTRHSTRWEILLAQTWPEETRPLKKGGVRSRKVYQILDEGKIRTLLEKPPVDDFIDWLISAGGGMVINRVETPPIISGIVDRLIEAAKAEESPVVLLREAKRLIEQVLLLSTGR